ncbi:MAG TPA: SelL-related redox protein [Saprospiraceae bacterium]|mgnify:CR=1 FL=1|nr:SelL-related redox protein [Saprospiraceae bacterium]
MSEIKPSIAHPEFWERMLTVNSGESLAEMSDKQPVMLVFLRFFGCSFCREAISDISLRRKNLETNGFRVVFVHMAPEKETAEKFFKKYKLFPVDHIADPEKVYYRAFGLARGTPQQIFGLMNWIRGFQAVVLEGHGSNNPTNELGDGFQMPGVFVVHRGAIRSQFIHKNPYDRPDYEEICQI